MQHQQRNAAAGAGEKGRTEDAVIAGLEEIGMPEITRSIAEGSPSLAKAVLEHCKFRFFGRARRHVHNRSGYVVYCFRSPEAAGFTKDDSGAWQVPLGQPAVARMQRIPDRAAKIAAERQAKGLEVEAMMHAEDLRRQRWESLPDVVKEKVRKHVRARGPLYASQDNESLMFRGTCMMVSEQWEKEGKL